MSCLSKDYRLNSQRDILKLYKSGKSWHTPSFVAFFDSKSDLKIAFVASKKVGNAVLRNKAKRRMRAMLLNFEDKIKIGSYIFVAKIQINTKNFSDLKKDFDFAMKGLEVLK